MTRLFSVYCSLLSPQLTELPPDAQLDQYVKRGDWAKVYEIAGKQGESAKSKYASRTSRHTRPCFALRLRCTHARTHSLFSSPRRAPATDIVGWLHSFVLAVHAASLAKDNRHKEALFVFAKYEFSSCAWPHSAARVCTLFIHSPLCPRPLVSMARACCCLARRLRC